MSKKKFLNLVVICLISGSMIIGCNSNSKDGLKSEESNEVTVETVLKDSSTETEKEIIANKEREAILEIVESQKDNLTKLVNKQNALEDGYKPNDLVKANLSSTKEIFVREVCIADLENMFNDAQKEGLNLCLVSGFRSMEYQSRIYNNSLNNRGFEHTDKYVAKPSHSEHQTGLAVDISCKSVGFDLTEEFKNTAEGQWLKDNAHKYGFILRYSNDRVSDTGYAFEPWHFRYLGKDVSTYIYQNNLILEDLF